MRAYVRQRSVCFERWGYLPLSGATAHAGRGARVAVLGGGDAPPPARDWPSVLGGRGARARRTRITGRCAAPRGCLPPLHRSRSSLTLMRPGR